jgi:hypothetical protein
VVGFTTGSRREVAGKRKPVIREQHDDDDDDRNTVSIPLCNNSARNTLHVEIKNDLFRVFTFYSFPFVPLPLLEVLIKAA